MKKGPCKRETFSHTLPRFASGGKAVACYRGIGELDLSERNDDFQSVARKLKLAAPNLLRLLFARQTEVDGVAVLGQTLLTPSEIGNLRKRLTAILTDLAAQTQSGLTDEEVSRLVRLSPKTFREYRNRLRPMATREASATLARLHFRRFFEAPIDGLDDGIRTMLLQSLKNSQTPQSDPDDYVEEEEENG